MSAFYNELDAYPAQWMRNLIDAGHIAPGVVDERSVSDLEPKDLDGYEQAHFFAGIGVWSYALRLAGWDDARPVWTGSCPCQPFSAAGKRRGVEDDRHLWPAWFRLIRECRPPVVFGEQVGGAAGLAWLDAVHADLEGSGYAVGAACLPAAGVGAPHIRSRLFFVAVAGGERIRWGRELGDDAAPSGEVPGEVREQRLRPDARAVGAAGELADDEARRRGEVDPLGCGSAERDGASRGERPRDGREPRGMAYAANGDNWSGAAWRGRNGSTDDRHAGLVGDAERPAQERLGRIRVPLEPEQETGRPGDAGAWSRIELVQCADGKARPTQPGIFPLAHGAPARVGRLRAYGNAIVAPLAAEFVSAAMEAME